MLPADPSQRSQPSGTAPLSCRGWWRHLASPVAAGAVLAAFWVFLQASLWEKSVTHDEIAHVTAGYSYWRFNDYRLQPENGNLPQRVAALPCWPATIRSPRANPRSGRFPINGRWPTNGFTKWATTPPACCDAGGPCAACSPWRLGALVWWWSRRLFGPWGAMLSLLLYVLSPAILANGALMTSDTAAALFFLAATLGWWRAIASPHRPTGAAQRAGHGRPVCLENVRPADRAHRAWRCLGRGWSAVPAVAGGDRPAARTGGTRAAIAGLRGGRGGARGRGRRRDLELLRFSLRHASAGRCRRRLAGR